MNVPSLFHVPPTLFPMNPVAPVPDGAWTVTPGLSVTVWAVPAWPTTLLLFVFVVR